MTPMDLQVLALELNAVMPPAPSREVVLTASGEILSAEAIALARAYEKATGSARAAFDALLVALT